jgi:hypothetical protein
MYSCTAGLAAEQSEPADGRTDGAVDHEYHEWLEPVPPLVENSNYVSGEESEAEQITDDSKQQGEKGRRRAGRKLVPVWRLVSSYHSFCKHIIRI